MRAAADVASDSVVVICKIIVFCSITFHTVVSLFCLTDVLFHLRCRFHFAVSRGPRVLIRSISVSVRSLATIVEGDARNCIRRLTHRRQISH
jgi:hypothetical protein